MSSDIWPVLLFFRKTGLDMKENEKITDYIMGNRIDDNKWIV